MESVLQIPIPALVPEACVCICVGVFVGVMGVFVGVVWVFVGVSVCRCGVGVFGCGVGVCGCMWYLENYKHLNNR